MAPVRCLHNEDAKLSASKKPDSYGRRPRVAQCSFFQWVDDPSPLDQHSQKRKLATPPDTDGKRRRLADIQAGLRDREQDALPFTGGSSSTQVSDTPTEPAEEEPRRHYSFLGLNPSQGSPPSTPKRQVPLIYGFRAEPSVLPTPPETLKVQMPGLTQEPVTPTQHKGKGPASSQWRSFTAVDDENPFDEGSSGQPSTPTTGERITNAVSGIQNAFRTFEDEFNSLDAANYIQRLERQNRALEIKVKAKTKRIEDLEIECEVLREKLRRAEERNEK